MSSSITTAVLGRAGSHLPRGRQADPPRHGGYLRLQSPLTRSPGVRLISDEDYFAAIGAQADGVAYCASLPPETDPEAIERRQAWLSEHPPAGWRVPRWRLQLPLMRVPAGMRTVSLSDYGWSERALVAGIARGLDAGSHGGGAGEQGGQ